MDRISLTEFAGTRSRSYAAREYTGEQRSRRHHVAVGLWEKPWNAGADAERYFWVLAVDSGRGERELVKGDAATDDARTQELIDALGALARTRNTGRRGLWIVTGHRRKALRTALENAGYDPTGTFAPDNRASRRASLVVQRQKSKLRKKAPRTNPARDVPPAQWLPNYSRAANRPEKVTISCDASSDTVRTGAMCFVADNGDYALRTRRTGAGVDELELEAITMALKYAARAGARTVHVETDSAGALDAVNHLRRIPARGKPFKGISPGALSRFTQAHTELTGTASLTVTRVVGHSEDPLNKAADQIAYLGLRASVHPQKAVQASLREGIEAALPTSRARPNGAGRPRRRR